MCLGLLGLLPRHGNTVSIYIVWGKSQQCLDYGACRPKLPNVSCERYSELVRICLSYRRNHTIHTGIPTLWPLCVCVSQGVGMGDNKWLSVIFTACREQPPRAHPGYQVLSDILFRLGLIANAHTVQCLDCSDLNWLCNHYHLFWHGMTLLVDDVPLNWLSVFDEMTKRNDEVKWRNET